MTEIGAQGGDGRKRDLRRGIMVVPLAGGHVQGAQDAGDPGLQSGAADRGGGRVGEQSGIALEHGHVDPQRPVVLPGGQRGRASRQECEDCQATAHAAFIRP